MPKLIGLRFGDLIVNNHLRSDNPKFCGVFTKETASTKLSSVIELNDTNGNFWTVSNNQGSKLEVNGNIDFEQYLKDYDKKLKAVK